MVSLSAAIEAVAWMAILVNQKCDTETPNWFQQTEKLKFALMVVLLHDLKLKGKGSFYIAQYPVRWTAQSALHFLPSLADLFIPTPTRLLREAF